MLSRQEFLTVVENAPLMAIDFVVQHPRTQKFLVGRRTNPPAKELYFVPGGRVRKNERQADAIARISKMEFGVEFKREDLLFIGLFEHLYPESPFEEGVKGTHYCVCGVLVKHGVLSAEQCDAIANRMQDAQHSESQWMALDDLFANENVHDNTKAYFLDGSLNRWFAAREYPGFSLPVHLQSKRL